MAEQTTNTSVTEPAPEPTAAEILAFDPFAPPKTPAETPPVGDAVTSGGTEGTPPAKVEPGKEPAKVAPTVPTPTPTAPSNLERLIADQTAALRASLADKGAPAKPEAPAAPKFNLGVPEQIINAIASEDPQQRSLGLHAIVNGVANAVWKEAEQMVKTQVETVMSNIPRMLEAHSTVVQKQREVHDDFYGTYTVFPNKDPAFVALVQNVGQLVARDFMAAGKALEWGPEMRDEIANRLFTSFPMLKVAHEAAKKAAPATAKAKPSPFVAGQGSRPAPAAGNEFMDVLKH